MRERNRALPGESSGAGRKRSAIRIGSNFQYRQNLPQWQQRLKKSRRQLDDLLRLGEAGHGNGARKSLHAPARRLRRATPRFWPFLTITRSWGSG